MDLKGNVVVSNPDLELLFAYDILLGPVSIVLSVKANSAICPLRTRHKVWYFVTSDS